MKQMLSYELREGEEALLNELRKFRRAARSAATSAGSSGTPPLTTGQRVADAVASTMGSWRFIIIQTTILFFWIALNVTAFVERWDPYPFILLNLALPFQAAYAAPFIMMSQNRQQDIDRRAAENDYRINIKSELEIELLHQKIDQLKETEFSKLIDIVNNLSDVIKNSASGRSHRVGETK